MERLSTPGTENTIGGPADRRVAALERPISSAKTVYVPPVLTRAVSSNSGVSTDDRDGSTDAEEAADRDGESTSFVPSSVENASGYGLSLTLVGGVLLALDYYGYLAVSEQGFGEALPAPFYLLVIAVLFVLELTRSRESGGMAIVRATAFALVYGALTAFAIEGAVYLWTEPEVALDGFVGVTVLAASLVVAALVYFVYLSAIGSDVESRQ